MRPRLLSFVALGFAACAPISATVGAPTPAASAPSAPPPPSAPRSPAPSAPSPTTPAAAPPQAPPGPPARLVPAPRLDDVDEARRWLARAGVASPDAVHDVMGCVPTSIGEPPRPGLLCVGTRGPMASSFSSGESVFPLRITVVERGTLRTVLEVPISAGPLDRLIDPDPDDPNEGSYLLLEAAVEDDGKSVVVREKLHPRARCASVLGSLDTALVRHREVIALACRAFGIYRWQGGRFVKHAGRPATEGGSSR